MENLKDLVNLLYKHIRGELTTEESIQLKNWVQQSEENQKFFDKATDTKQLLADVKIKNENLQKMDMEQAKQRLKKMLSERPAEPKTKVISIKWRRYAVAASLLLVALTSAWLWLRPGKQQSAEIVVTPKEVNDVLPDTKNAVLTLDDGTTIILDSAQNGMLATQGEMRVVKKTNGQLVYEGNPLTTHHSPLTYNTISVPKGSDVIFLTLSDGSKVWMNAASSIRYPIVFTGNERRVEITGEAYFEVAHDKRKPFFVTRRSTNTDDAWSVQVLGTHFNVNAYEEEGNIKVTLLEGSIRVKSEVVPMGRKNSEVLKPREQAILTEKSLLKKQDPNLEEVMAWKNGIFFFDNTDLAAIMRQIERWYDVDVSYEGHLLAQEITLTGEISRYSNASQVLELLETTRLLHFTIDGRKISVKTN